MPCPINWCAFTWEAFATLATGAAAVGGATFIGLRQLKITGQQAGIAARQTDVASRQADILEHQVQVDRAKLRADLFDRRLAVYKACKAYIRGAMSVRAEFDTSFELAQELGTQLEQAEFLFAGEVRELLRRAANEADDLLAERETMRDLREGSTAPSPEMRQQARKVREKNKKLRRTLDGLAQAMGEEMRLYIPRAGGSSIKEELSPHST
jgi:hypothetical protein